jgi:iron complex outermembrane receptor protein
MRPVVVCVQSVGLAALVGVGAPALAQEVSGPAGDDRIVITATRQAEDASDIPQSIVVLSGDQLAGADGAEDVVQRLVGVQAAISNGSQTTFQIRGVGAVDHQALTPSAAAVHVDGVFLATNVQASLLAYDLDRVEVLKGPQGTIQGRNASSGSINFITARPTDAFEAYAEASYGSFDRLDVRGRRQWTDRRGRAGAHRHARVETGARSRMSAAPTMPAACATSSAYAAHWRSTCRRMWSCCCAAMSRLIRASIPRRSTRRSRLEITRYRSAPMACRTPTTASTAPLPNSPRDAGDWRIVSLSSFEGFGQDYGFDFDGQPAAIANLSYDRAYWQVAQELYGRTSWDGGDLLIGLSLSSDDFTQDYLIWCGQLNPTTLVGSCAYPAAAARVGPTPASTAPAVSLLTRIAQTREMAALYSVVDLELGPQTTLTLGGRYTMENIDGEGFGQHIYADGVRALNNRGGLGLAQGETRSTKAASPAWPRSSTASATIS